MLSELVNIFEALLMLMKKPSLLPCWVPGVSQVTEPLLNVPKMTIVVKGPLNSIHTVSKYCCRFLMKLRKVSLQLFIKLWATEVRLVLNTGTVTTLLRLYSLWYIHHSMKNMKKVTFAIR